MVGDLFIKHYCIMLSCNFEHFDVIWRLKNPSEIVSLYSVYARSPLPVYPASRLASSFPFPTYLGRSKETLFAGYFPFLIMHLIYLKNFAKALCSISLGTAVIPRRIEKQRLCKIWGQKRCIMGNGEMWKCVAYIKYLTLIKGILWSRGALSSRTS